MCVWLHAYAPGVACFIVCCHMSHNLVAHQHRQKYAQFAKATTNNNNSYNIHTHTQTRAANVLSVWQRCWYHCATRHTSNNNMRHRPTAVSRLHVVYVAKVLACSYVNELLLNFRYVPLTSTSTHTHTHSHTHIHNCLFGEKTRLFVATPSYEYCS